MSLSARVTNSMESEIPLTQRSAPGSEGPPNI